MTELATPRRGRPRSPQADADILTAALDLLGEVGISRVSMDALAARAGVAKATIYRRWSSRDELILEAIITAVSALQPVDTGALRSDLTVYMAEVAERMRSGKSRDLMPHLIAASAEDASLRAGLDKYAATRRQPLNALLRRAIERGELPAHTDITMAIDLLLGPLFHRRLFDDLVYDAAECERLVDVVIRGIS